MGPPQGRAEGEENLPRPAGHTPLDALQDPVGLLGSQGTLLAHGHPVVPQHSQSLSAELLSSRSAPACTSARVVQSDGVLVSIGVVAVFGTEQPGRGVKKAVQSGIRSKTGFDFP